MDKPLKNLSTRLSKSTRSSEILFYLHGEPINLKKDVLAAKSAKLAVLFREKSDEEVCLLLRDLVINPEYFELVANFCYGFELHISTENIVPLICLAWNLEMTESHCANNLLRRALDFLERQVLPSWNETIKAFNLKENMVKQAMHIGLHKACIESVVSKALVDPRFLGESANSDGNSEDKDDRYRPNARKRLFVPDWKSISLTTLSFPLYGSIIEVLSKTAVPSEYVAGSLYSYVKRWVDTKTSDKKNMSTLKRNSNREIIEKVERFLPDKIGILPCKLLFEMLQFAIELEASFDCKNGFEIRIGKQLEEATVVDLVILSRGFGKHTDYNVECLRRILKNFYAYYIRPDSSGLVIVAERIEKFLAEVARDIELRMETFILLAEMSVAASSGISRTSDGIYRAINIYLDEHQYLTESEREEVCQLLDCSKLSPEACQHAAKNERLPLRIVVQVLFAGQLQLRDVIMKEVRQETEAEPREEAAKENEATFNSGGELRTEMEEMNKNVIELEQECLLMKKEMKVEAASVGKEKPSIWKAMKRKLGCTGSHHDYCDKSIKKKKRHFK